MENGSSRSVQLEHPLPMVIRNGKPLAIHSPVSPAVLAVQHLDLRSALTDLPEVTQSELKRRPALPDNGCELSKVGSDGAKTSWSSGRPVGLLREEAARSLGSRRSRL
ncbi:protein of unknown function [Bradyrhizobium vignae]|uniref:Uncharacterized protein n=1 Tax=Bradyrhizobium vignae TaxID=1549949 RepID=A0A2U3Q9S4_9BRAD|nr:protein of unknown function [Bradyrhizobium vignae]